MMIAAILSDRLQRTENFYHWWFRPGDGWVWLSFRFSSNWVMVAIAGTMMGVGFTIFYSLGLTMISQILPSSASRGKDLGVINIASTLPQIILPGAGAVVLGFFDAASPAGFSDSIWRWFRVLVVRNMVD